MNKKELKIIEPLLNYNNFKLNLKIKKMVELFLFLVSVALTISMWYYNPRSEFKLIDFNFYIKNYQFYDTYLILLYLIVFALTNTRYLLTKYITIFINKKNRKLLKIYFKENEIENNEFPFSLFYISVLSTLIYTNSLNLITYLLTFILLYMVLNNIYELIIGVFLGDLNTCRNLHISYNKIKYEENLNNSN